MYDDQTVEFFGSILWSYFDNIVSNNSINFGYFSSLNKDYKDNLYITNPRFKLDIKGKTTNKDSNITFDSSMLYRLSYTLKNEILNNIKTDISKFTTDQKWSHGFSFKGYKKNLYVTVMWNDLTNQAVLRFMIGVKEQTILESDKVYIPVLDFFALCEIMKQAFNQYTQFCSNIMVEGQMLKLQKLTQELSFSQKQLNNSCIINKNEKVDVLSGDILGISSKQSEEVKVEPVKTQSTDLLDINLNDVPVKKIEDKIEKLIEEDEPEEESTGEQGSFDSFLKEKRDSFELDLPYESEIEVTKEQRESKKDSELERTNSKFIEKVCKNDFSVLEQLMFNLISNDLPLNTFVEIVKKEMDVDLSDGISVNDYNSLNYIITNNLKISVSNLLEKKVDLPKSITPIIVDNENRTEDKIDIMYHLITFYIYLAKVKTILSEKNKNALDNKEFYSYILKTITNPLVFSYFKHIPIDIFEREISYRYNKLWNDGFFDNFVKSVNEKIKVNNLKISNESIIDNLKSIYDSVSKFGDKLKVENCFNGKSWKLSYKSFSDNILNLETVAKICRFEICINKYGKIIDKALNLNSYDDIPLDILKLYGIKIAKFDSSILLKYFNENFKGFKDLEQIKKINRNVYDIIDSINPEQYDDRVLRALYFWDVEELPKSLTYFQFKNMIDKSSLEKNQLISMILNREKVIDPDFYNSFLVSASDNV